MSTAIIVALDGHDGAGKTTLAAALAKSLGGVAVRPFAGKMGADLMQAGKSQNISQLLEIGTSAIQQAIESVPEDQPLVLDRAWMTVASFVPHSRNFFDQWQLWVPTALCWADIETTISRLSIRKHEDSETLAWHQHYLSVYMELAQSTNSMIVRTDKLDQAASVNTLLRWAQKYYNKDFPIATET